jgi:hypothetical protein
VTTSSQRKAKRPADEPATPAQLAGASRAQAIVSRRVPEAVSLVEQLLAERHREAVHG